MLASHTSIRHLFSKCLSQYEKLRKKQAFLDNYRKFPMFAVSTYGLNSSDANLVIGLLFYLFFDRKKKVIFLLICLLE